MSGVEVLVPQGILQLSADFLNSFEQIEVLRESRTEAYFDVVGRGTVKIHATAGEWVNRFPDTAVTIGASEEGGRIDGSASTLALRLNASSHDDVLIGGKSNDHILMGQGKDVAYGGSGNDYIYAYFDHWSYTGTNSQYGEGGNDTLQGGYYDDRLFGGSGNDRLLGATGNDVLNGGTGADRMIGGAGNDTYVVDHAKDTVVERVNEGRDTVKASIDYRLTANVENLVLSGRKDLSGIGNKLANVLDGNAGDNTLNGAAGNDLLRGGAGNDTLLGGQGADRLIGGAGADRLNGGGGADTFIFNSASDTLATARDTISDFGTGDRISLKRIDADTSLAGNQAFDFLGYSKFTGDAGELTLLSSSRGTLVRGDVDGDKKADFAIFVLGASDLTADAFIF
ncbi:calcium-binding protein [Paracoccus aerius]